MWGWRARAQPRAGAWGPLGGYVDVRCGVWELHSACLFLLEQCIVNELSYGVSSNSSCLRLKIVKLGSKEAGLGGLLLLRFRPGPRLVPFRLGLTQNMKLHVQMAVVVSNPSSFPSEGNCLQTGACYCRLSCAVLLEAVDSPSHLLLLLLPSQQLFLDQAGCLLLGVCVREPWGVPFQGKGRRFLPLAILHCCDLLRDVEVPEEGIPH